MTSFLRLNGIAVPVAHSSGPSVTQEDIGKMRRAIDGTPVIPRRTVKRHWKFATSIKSASESLAWRDLVSGRGHVLSFDSQNYYTSKGMAPVSVGANWAFTTSGPKYGAACAQWTNTNSVWALGSAASGAKWTLGWWLNVGGAGWHHYMVSSATGSGWVDGVAGGSVVGLVSMTSGVATFGSGSASKIDDIIALPFELATTSTWPAQIFGFGSAFGLLPVLQADGLFIEQNSQISVVGGEPAGRAVRSAADKDLHDFSFELFER